MTNERVSSLKYETRISRFSVELEEYLNSFRLARECDTVSRRVNAYGEFIIFSRVITVANYVPLDAKPDHSARRANYITFVIVNFFNIYHVHILFLRV